MYLNSAFEMPIQYEVIQVTHSNKRNICTMSLKEII